MTLAIDIPTPNTHIYDIAALKKQLTAFAMFLVASPSATKDAKVNDIHIFDSLHTDWGGAADAHEVAEFIRQARNQHIAFKVKSCTIPLIDGVHGSRPLTEIFK